MSKPYEGEKYVESETGRVATVEKIYPDSKILKMKDESGKLFSCVFAKFHKNWKLYIEQPEPIPEGSNILRFSKFPKGKKLVNVEGEYLDEHSSACVERYLQWRRENIKGCKDDEKLNVQYGVPNP